ncbi:hypothetical protein ONZ45_g3662 [Pleurotus djamor]|nr:hypothetical protein ONZ45_g3662 [Pleurotus djamor]
MRLGTIRQPWNPSDEEIGPHALRKRAIKADKISTRMTTDAQLYHGARGHYHYYQCQQLILRLQIAFLIKEWALPPEFEAVCRDIWALHLARLPNPPPPEPYNHAQNMISTPPPPKGGRVTTGERSEDGGPQSEDDDLPNPIHLKDVEDPELEQLLYENSEPSSSSSEDEDEEKPQQGDEGEPERKAGRPPTRRPQEGLQGTLSVLVLALWTLRVPVMYIDIINLIEAYKLPYLEVLRLLPREMTRHLTKYNVLSLSPAHPPRVLGLHALVSHLAKQLKVRYKVPTPEANATLYALTKRLAGALSLPLLLHRRLSPELARLAKSHPQGYKFDNIPPEVAFAALTVMVLKMVYGLDGYSRLVMCVSTSQYKLRAGLNRVPTSGDDPATWMPRLADFINIVKTTNVAEETSPEHLFSASAPASVTDLSDEVLDKYLDFCQRSLVGDWVDPKLFGEPVLNRFFPLGSRMNVQECSNSRVTHGPDLRANVASESTHEGDQTALRPAEAYAIYHARDVFGSLEEDIELFLERSGKIVGVAPGYVLSVVEGYEKRLATRWKQKRYRPPGKEKRMRGGQDEELILDEEDDD